MVAVENNRPQPHTGTGKHAKQSAVTPSVSVDLHIHSQNAGHKPPRTHTHTTQTHTTQPTKITSPTQPSPHLQPARPSPFRPAPRQQPGPIQPSPHPHPGPVRPLHLQPALPSPVATRSPAQSSPFSTCSQASPVQSGSLLSPNLLRVHSRPLHKPSTVGSLRSSSFATHSQPSPVCLCGRFGPFQPSRSTANP